MYITGPSPIPGRQGAGMMDFHLSVGILGSNILRLSTLTLLPLS